MTRANAELVERANFGEDGLLPAIVQESGSGNVLMLAWMDAEALRRTIDGGLVTFWSRSRREYWRKGDTSGNHLVLTALALDCDSDALLVTVEPVAAACHTGSHSCFDADRELGSA
ncbi:phosphoribosyl-AMP cyclohydrolase [Cryobacterium mesophilum]|uniref:Histidine biosynthesis bifunctional protein HisIE n=1 Tax=Terrimesophilobacter mesophilus TaxID=433647 RepID=A0A4R8V6T8_9MICO|nr:phosphoribosyl-AMP cyclohydrolase [Terrimesophilobacter mesophilus]MBB5631896.1 phosphoribosyl-AMP cyclohydrolase [Terrimesophilobacter mesophilus]TFB78804.1 phosphoribosyl-AMP cyclohydrolase [Terrimesophilobacter mesophilus]